VTRHIAFLRGINLGKRRLTNEELRAHFAAIGMEAVATFRASGNVVFDDPRGESEASLAERVEAGLGERLGYDVPVYLRSLAELAAIVAHEPFDAGRLARSRGKLQVSMLAAAPSAGARHEALALAGDDDLLAIAGRELYWLPAGGISDSGLDLKAIEAALGAGTIRTMGTIAQIATKFG
jgi:uncharacterized protein (DUF1697 family)